MRTSQLFSTVNFRCYSVNEARSLTQRSAEAMDRLVNSRVVNDDICTAGGPGRHEVNWIWTGWRVSEKLFHVPCRLPLRGGRNLDVSGGLATIGELETYSVIYLLASHYAQSSEKNDC